MSNSAAMVDQSQDSAVSHTQLFVAIESMKEQIIYMRKEIERLNANHDKEMEGIKKDNKQLTEDVVELRIRAGQVAALSALFAIIIPIIITLLSPKLQLSVPPAAAHERIPSHSRQNELPPAN